MLPTRISFAGFIVIDIKSRLLKNHLLPTGILKILPCKLSID
jgi:hypothetical protein